MPPTWREKLPPSGLWHLCRVGCLGSQVTPRLRVGAGPWKVCSSGQKLTPGAFCRPSASACMPPVMGSSVSMLLVSTGLIP